MKTLVSIPLVALMVSSAGCSVIYPELTTPTTPYPEGQAPNERGPDDLHYLAIVGASIPRKTRDGRAWDEVGGQAPDPFAVLEVDGKELIRTPILPNTFEPRWKEADAGNYRVGRLRRARIAVWDANAVTNRPICVYVTNDLSNDVINGKVRVDCDSGATVLLEVQPPRPERGLGLYYELRATSVFVTRVMPESPSSRAGLSSGMEIVSVQGKPVSSLTPLEIESYVNAHAGSGLDLELKTPKGARRQVRLHEGPVYPVKTPRHELEVTGGE